jgi:hypothetical protein
MTTTTAAACSRILVDDVLDMLIEYIPRGERLCLRVISHQFDAVIKRNFLRQGRWVFVRATTHTRDKSAAECRSVLRTLFPPLRESQWLQHVDLDLPASIKCDLGVVSSYLQHLHSIDIIQEFIDDSFYTLLTSLRRLIHANAVKVTNNAITPLTNLRFLVLSRARFITDKAFAPLTSLTSLTLTECVKVKGSFLSMLTDLRTLAVRFGDFDAANVSTLNGLESLELRSISHFTGQEITPQCATTLRSLRVVECRDFMPMSLTRLCNLRVLELDCRHVSQRLSAWHFAALTALTRLDLMRSGYVDEDFAAHLPALRVLDMTVVSMVHLDLRGAAATLAYASFNGCYYLRDASLPSLTQLRYLALRNCEMFSQDELIETLENAKLLRTLDINRCRHYTDELVPHLTALTFLDAYHTRLTLPLVRQTVRADCQLVIHEKEELLTRVGMSM